MSTDDSHCRFLNCACKFFIPLKFHDEGIYKACSYNIYLHTDGANVIPNASFSTPPLAPRSQCCRASTESKSEHTSQEPPTSKHDNFLPLTPSETSETAVP